VIKPFIEDKTLVAWVTLGEINQRGGSVLDSYQLNLVQNGKNFQSKHNSPRKLGIINSSLSFREVATT